MAVGVFLGIRASFNDQKAAAAFLAAITSAARLKGLPEYEESATPVVQSDRQGIGRSEVDHHSAGVLAALAGYVPESASPNLRLIERNPYRVAFLPFDFRAPLETEYREAIAGAPTEIWVGSARGLRNELQAIAPALGIPLTHGVLADRTAALINCGDSLENTDEDAGLLEDERTAWLLLYEGAVLAVAHGVALSLAG